MSYLKNTDQVIDRFLLSRNRFFLQQFRFFRLAGERIAQDTLLSPTKSLEYRFCVDDKRRLSSNSQESHNFQWGEIGLVVLVSCHSSFGGWHLGFGVTTVDNFPTLSLAFGRLG